MKPIENLEQLCKYLERRERYKENKLEIAKIKYDRNKTDENEIRLCALYGSKKELQTIMLRIVGERYTYLKRQEKCR